MDRHPALVFQERLEAGERLMWAGRPGGGVRVRASDATSAGFALTWMVFAITWTWQAYRQGAPWWYAALAAPFLLAGVYLLTFRYVVDARIRRHVVYAITDRRVAALYAGRRMFERSLPLSRISAIHLQRHRDGTGTLLFVPLPETAEPRMEEAAEATGTETVFRLPARRPPPGALRFEFLEHPQAILDEAEEARRLAVQTAA